MFGYVTINKGELKVKDYECYKSYYCGLCSSLKDSYGALGQFTLTYDMTFVHLLLSGLYEPREQHIREHCMAHPAARHLAVKSEISKYCADMNMLLAYYKFLDDWNDDKSKTAFVMTAALKKKCQEAARKNPIQAKAIKRYIEEQKACEESLEKDLDKVSGCTGRMLGVLLSYKDDIFKERLYKLGFNLGKFIYLMDAYDDLKKDKENASYNPLVDMSSQADFDKEIYDILSIVAAEAAKEFEMLPVLKNAEIIRNIIYSGIWARFNGRKDEESEKKS